MARRYTRSDKEKWVAKPSPPPKKSPIRIPASNNEALIAQNKLTLIGRVTNTRFQRPRAVVDIMPQIWNLEGRVEGSDLGPELFQFRFESENDLLSVLAKGPYHHKRWMLLIQRWEPIISPTFPSIISFWIRIHGIPLHYWTDEALHTIGKALGAVSTRDVREARIRVDINGLQPLEMKSEIELPSGEVTEVEFEYLKIEKHCFTCFSLFHEETDCPRRSRHDPPAKNRKLGITQAIALERIEADKRRHDERRGYRPPDSRQAPLRIEGHERSRQSHRYSDNRVSQDPSRQETSNYTKYSNTSRPSVVLKNSDYHNNRSRREYVPRADSYQSRSIPPFRRRELTTVQTKAHALSPNRHMGTSSPLRNCESSEHTPSPRPRREPMRNGPEPVMASLSQKSQERRSALERIAEPDLRDQLERRGSLSGDSGKLFEITARPDDSLPQIPTLTENMIQSASRNSALQRLGGLASLGSRERTWEMLQTLADSPTAAEPAMSTQGIKRKQTKATGKRKVARSPLQGLNLRKSRVVPSLNPPRKKLCTDKSALPCDKAGPSTHNNTTKKNSTVPIPTRRNLGKDFRSLPPSLP